MASMHLATKVMLPPSEAYKERRAGGGGLAAAYKKKRQESARKKKRAPLAPLQSNVPVDGSEPTKAACAPVDAPAETAAAEGAEAPGDEGSEVVRLTRDASGTWSSAGVAEAPAAEARGGDEPSVEAIRAEIEAIQETLDPETREAAARQLDLLAEYESAWAEVASPEAPPRPPRPSWTRCYDSNYKTYYYYDDATGESSWAAPASGEWVDDDALQPRPLALDAADDDDDDDDGDEARDSVSPLPSLRSPRGTPTPSPPTLSVRRRDVALGLFVVAFSAVAAVSLANYGARVRRAAAPTPLLASPDAAYKAEVVKELQNALAELQAGGGAVAEATDAPSTPFSLLRRGFADLLAPIKAFRAFLRVLKKLLLLDFAS